MHAHTLSHIHVHETKLGQLKLWLFFGSTLHLKKKKKGRRAGCSEGLLMTAKEKKQRENPTYNQSESAVHVKV